MNKEEMRSSAEQAAAMLPLYPLQIKAGIQKTAQGPKQQYIYKAGILPFIRLEGQKELSYYLMKPKESERFLNPSKFQICKGSREYSRYKGKKIIWKNYTPKQNDKRYILQLETLLVTALREGIEEIGLRPDNVAQLYEWGHVEFRSETTGKSRNLWLFLAEIIDKKAFDQPDEVHANTGARQWLQLSTDSELIREDYLVILQKISASLQVK